MSGDHTSSAVAVRVRRLEQRLIDAGLTDDDQLDAVIDQILSGSPANGARVVARGWVARPSAHGS
jgi:nitrile hydratase